MKWSIEKYLTHYNYSLSPPIEHISSLFNCVILFMFSQTNAYRRMGAAVISAAWLPAEGWCVPAPLVSTWHQTIRPVKWWTTAPDT